MKRPLWRFLASAAVLGAFCGLADGRAQAQTKTKVCDRACLKKAMANYLDHLAQGKPAGVPFSPQLIMRENAKVVRPGEGGWATLGKVRGGQTFADPMTGQAVFQGVLDRREGGYAVVFLRIRLAGGRISEVETIVNDNPKSPMFQPQDMLEPDIIYLAPVEPRRRSSRAELAEIVTHYMDAIGLHDGKLAPFSPRCDRWASGYKVTNNAKRKVEEGGGTCAESLEGLKGQNSVDRRIPVIDPELGVASILFMIPHGERQTPSSTYVSEIIKVADGRIRSIEEVSTSAPFPPDSGFSASK